MSKQLQIRNSTAEFLIFQAEDKAQGVQVFYKDDTIWATQKAMATLFDVDRSVITKHLKNIFETGELQQDSVSAKFAHTAEDGKTPHYFISWMPSFLPNKPKTLPRRSSRNTASSKTAFSNPISTNSLYRHYLLMNKNNRVLQVFNSWATLYIFHPWRKPLLPIQWKDAPGKKSKVSIFEDQWITL